MSKKLRWKKEAPETGLRAVGAAPRGSYLHDGEIQYASVSSDGGGWRGPVKGWYWVAGWDSAVPYMNSYPNRCPDEAAAKAEAMAYVKAHLSKD